MSQAKDPGTLGRAAGRGAAWALLSTVLARSISLLALAVLARLLTPEDFGVVALALVFITYAETVGDLGAGAALIYWPGQRQAAARTAFWVGFAMGWGWWLVAQLAAPWLAAFFHEAEAENLLRVLAFIFPIKALANTHDALCQKDLRFRRRMVAEAALFAGKAVVSIGLAVLGFGVWSLVYGQLVGTALWALALWKVVSWRPSWPPSPEMLGPLLRYGRSIVAVNIIAAVVHHADVVVVGRMQGSEELGLYQVAYKIPEITVALLIWVVGKVLFPTFARLQNSPQALRDFYLRALRYIGTLGLPAAAGLFLLAEPIVLVLFGQKWVGATPMLRGIAVYMGIRVLGSHAGDVLKGIGRPGLLAGLGVLKAGVLLPALVVAGRYSTVSVAWTMAGVTVLTVSLNLWIITRLLEISPRHLVSSLRPTLFPLVLMCGAVLGWLRFSQGLGALVTVFIAVPLGVLVYVGALNIVDPELLKQLRSTLLSQQSDAGIDRDSRAKGVVHS